MKKILAVIAVFLVLFSLASCKAVKPQLTDEEVRESLSAEASKKVEESIKAQKEYNAGVEAAIEEIGKTVKGEKLVVKVPTVRGIEYAVFHFDKKELVKYRVSYYFFEQMDHYEDKIDVVDKDEKLIDKDKSLKMAVIKDTEVNELTFDQYYEYYTYEKVVSQGYEVIE